MNYKCVGLILRGVREIIEEGTGMDIGQVIVSASDVLEDVCRAFALSDEGIAAVLGEERPQASCDVLAVPILGIITGGLEDLAVWDGVRNYFGGGKGA